MKQTASGGGDYTNPGALPFTLTLEAFQGEDAALVCEQSLRVRPGKRQVCRGRWRGRSVVVKLFAPGKGAHRRFRKEADGLEALAQGGIDTPGVLYAGRSTPRGPFLIITEYQGNAVTLLESWNAEPAGAGREALLARLVRLIAAMHARGLVHADPHPGNFLVGGDTLWVLDGGDVRLAGKPLQRRASLANLGLVLAQLSGLSDAQQRALYEDYAQQRDWQVTRQDVVRLARLTARARRRRRRKYLYKVFRNCTAFMAERHPRRRLVCERDFYSPDVEAFRDNPEAFLRRATIKVLKDGNSSTVLLARMNDRRVVVKRYNMKSAWHTLRRALRGTRAATSWRNAHALEFDGIRTAHPHLLLEQRLGWLRGASWVVMEYVAGPTTRELFAGAAPLSGEQAAARAGVAALLRGLWELRISHGDMKATNIIVAGDGPVLLDLDALHTCRTVAGARRARLRDLRRFLENWRHRPDLQQEFATALESAGR